jgi:hypothetical protein
VADDEQPQGRRQLDEVLNKLQPFAHELLGKYGEFFPFGAAMERDGKLRIISGDTASEHPPSDEVISLLTNAMKEARDGYIAVGICYDVRVRARADAAPTDAICVALEHRDGTAVLVLEPYLKRDGALEYGSLIAQQGRRTVFGA